jgi:hypothetical protein
MSNSSNSNSSNSNKKIVDKSTEDSEPQRLPPPAVIPKSPSPFMSMSPSPMGNYEDSDEYEEYAKPSEIEDEYSEDDTEKFAKQFVKQYERPKPAQTVWQDLREPYIPNYETSLNDYVVPPESAKPVFDDSEMEMSSPRGGMRMYSSTRMPSVRSEMSTRMPSVRSEMSPRTTPQRRMSVDFSKYGMGTDSVHPASMSYDSMGAYPTKSYRTMGGGYKTMGSGYRTMKGGERYRSMGGGCGSGGSMTYTSMGGHHGKPHHHHKCKSCGCGMGRMYSDYNYNLQS